MITPLNLSSTVSILKELGRTEQAKDVLQFYLDNRIEEPGFWDLSGSHWRGHVVDPDVKAGFAAKFKALEVPPDAEQILKRIGEQNSWNPEDLMHLAVLTEADYVSIFKKRTGSELRNAVTDALFFRNIVNVDEKMKAITRTVEGALRQIATESSLNAKRVKNFGV